MKKAILGIGFALAAGAAVWGQDVRKPVFAGQFYDGDGARLAAQVQRFLEAADIGAPPAGRVPAIIVPHAGYVYSGPTAAFGYKIVRGQAVRSVVILAPSHRFGFRGGAVWPRGGFATPLGTADVDEGLAGAVIRTTGFREIPEAFAEEHAVEVQVPFIQTVFPEAKIVPVVLGGLDERGLRALAGGLADLMARPEILIVCSTDMSHYLPKAAANRTDAETAALIRDLRADALIKKLAEGENILCGGAAVAAVLIAARKADASEVRLLHYADSSDAGAPEDGVVGYLAAAVVADGRTPDFALSGGEKKELLRLARAAVEAAVRSDALPAVEAAGPNLTAARGAFVTLKKRGVLRGCIGFAEPVLPLAQAVLQAAVAAACEDPRFPRVAARELDELEYEISVLTPARRVYDPEQVRVGKHGLIIARGGRRGLLLPQVPVEQGWDRDRFLGQACLKAGLPETAWREGAEVYVFEAIVFR